MNESRHSPDPVAERFLTELDAEVAVHPAVRHPLLERLASTGGIDEFLTLGLHHRHLVTRFTHYLELLLLRAEDSRDKLWIAKVLVDEYGSDSSGLDHGELYRRYLGALGADDLQLAAAPHSEHAREFVREHERLCGEESWLVGLGAIGPGHEWALPRMFSQLHQGLQRLGFADEDVLYFPCHLEQDIEHGAWLREALLRHATTVRAQQYVREGTMRSLEARRRFWDAIYAEITRPAIDGSVIDGAEIGRAAHVKPVGS